MRDLALRGEDVGQLQRAAALRADFLVGGYAAEAGGDFYVFTGLLDAAFDDVGRVEFLADFFRRVILALEGKRRGLRGDAQAGDFPEAGEQFAGDAAEKYSFSGSLLKLAMARTERELGSGAGGVGQWASWAMASARSLVGAAAFAA